jgi:pilus assembly protein Flp/PilA
MVWTALKVPDRRGDTSITAARTGQPTRAGRRHTREYPVQNPFAALVSLVALATDRVRREEEGATAVEYGLLVGLIAAVIIAAVGFLGQDLLALFERIVTALPGGNA